MAYFHFYYYFIKYLQNCLIFQIYPILRQDSNWSHCHNFGTLTTRLWSKQKRCWRRIETNSKPNSYSSQKSSERTCPNWSVTSSPRGHSQLISGQTRLCRSSKRCPRSWPCSERRSRSSEKALASSRSITPSPRTSSMSRRTWSPSGKKKFHINSKNINSKMKQKICYWFLFKVFLLKNSA